MKLNLKLYLCYSYNFFNYDYFIFNYDYFYIYDYFDYF